MKYALVSILSLCLFLSLCAPARAQGGDTLTLVSLLSKSGGINEAQAASDIERVFSLIRAELKKGNSIEVRQFGRFYLSERKVKAKAKPQTEGKTGTANSETEKPATKHSVRFVASPILKLEVNK